MWHLKQYNNRNLQYPNGIRPQMFKSLVGKGHPEFSTKRQQDAQEFLLHLINLIEVRQFECYTHQDVFAAWYQLAPSSQFISDCNIFSKFCHGCSLAI